MALVPPFRDDCRQFCDIFRKLFPKSSRRGVLNKLPDIFPRGVRRTPGVVGGVLGELQYFGSVPQTLQTSWEVCRLPGNSHFVNLCGTVQTSWNSPRALPTTLAESCKSPVCVSALPSFVACRVCVTLRRSPGRIGTVQNISAWPLSTNRHVGHVVCLLEAHFEPCSRPARFEHSSGPQELKNIGHVDVVTYNTLLKGLCNTGDVASAKDRACPTERAQV